MGASEGLQSLFSYNSNPMLPHLFSNRECLDIDASFSISWTTISCMVLVSSCCSLSLAHFLPKASDSLLFLSWHILSVCCHFLLDVLGYARWSHSLFYILHLSLAWYFILWSICLILFSTRFSLQKGERQVFTFTPFFWDVRLYHLIIFLYWVWLESESEIFCYRWSIDLVTVLFFTPHSFFG